MIQSIVNGMIAAIRTEYDETMEIYTKSTEQDFTKPCFFILCSKSTDEQKVGTRRKKNYSFAVKYYPAGEEPQKECLIAAEKLNEILGIIDIESKKVRGKDMKYEMEEDVLKFEITYSFFVLAAAEAETMMDEFQVKTNSN